MELDYESDLTNLSDLETIARPHNLPSNPKHLLKTTLLVHPVKPPRRKPGCQQKRAKPRSHEIPPHLQPNIAAHQFRSVYRRRAQVADHLKKVFKTPTLIPVDFDLATAYFLQQTYHLKLGDIPICIDRVLADYTILQPLTGRQESLLLCAKEIKTTIDYYSANLNSRKPFALRYPNLESLNQLAMDRSRSPEIVGKDQAVVFIDSAGRAVACAIPPKDSVIAKTMSGTERGRVALVGAASVTGIPAFVGPMTFETFQRTSNLAVPKAESPYVVSPHASARLNGADSRFVEVPGMLNGTMAYQSVGYGRFSSQAAGMSDTQMALGTARQGHPSSRWQEQKPSEFNLPTLIQMGEEHAYKRESNARVESELIWHNEMARLVIKAFQPRSYAAAMQSLQVIVRHGTPATSRLLKSVVNPIGAGRHTMFGMQVDHHRDGNNATFASANFFGENYGGGELILNYLGYAVFGGPGYSVHGAYDILMHGVGKITRLPNSEGAPPQRICMAIYSHADIFASAARFSGMHQVPQVFSDPKLWIPFYPTNFSISAVLDVLKAERKRLYSKYQEEVESHQARVRAHLLNEFL